MGKLSPREVIGLPRTSEWQSRFDPAGALVGLGPPDMCFCYSPSLLYPHQSPCQRVSWQEIRSVSLRLLGH